MREKEGCCWPHRACSPPHSAHLSGASTLAISVYMRADQANSKPAVSPVQQVPHLPSCQVVQLGSEFLSLVPTVLPGAGPRHLTFTSRQHPASGSDPNLWHWSWDVTVWQVPTLCNEGGCNCPKSSSAVPGLGSLGHGMGYCAGTPILPQTLLLWPALLGATPATLPHVCLRSAQDSSYLGLGAGPLDIPRACPALPDPGQKGQGHPKSEGPKCRSHPPGLTLLRASTLVFLPVLDVMAHVVGATQARIDIFREIFLRQTTISCPLMPQGPYPKEEHSLGRPEPPSPLPLQVQCG